MTDKDKLVLRKPLAPTGDSEDCKADYEKLLAGFNELNKLKVEGIDFVSSFDEKDVVVSLENYNERVGEYTKLRDVYNEKYAGQIEAMEDVKANIRKIKEQMAAASEESDNQQKAFDKKWGSQEIPSPFPDDTNLIFENPEEWKRQSESCRAKFNLYHSDMMKVSEAGSAWAKLFSSLVDEERKFEEIQKEADEAFDYIARHTLADGTVLTDEELAEWERRKKQDK